MNLREEFGNEQNGDLLEQALRNFRVSVHAWSAAELSRARPVLAVRRRRSWRLAAGCALAGVLLAIGASGMFYGHHRQELKIAAARVAEQQRAAHELQAREDEEDLLAEVDSDVSQAVPSAMEPLVQLTAEGETASEQSTKTETRP